MTRWNCAEESDDSVRRLGKGPLRPINPLEDRAEVLSALRCESIIGKLKPEVHVKGGDYIADQLPEAQVVWRYGGEIKIVPLLEGRSTTRALKELGIE